RAGTAADTRCPVALVGDQAHPNLEDRQGQRVVDVAVSVAAIDATVEQQTAMYLLDLVQRDGVDAGAGWGARGPRQVREDDLAGAPLQVALAPDRGPHLRLDAAVLGAEVAAAPPVFDVERLGQ